MKHYEVYSEKGGGTSPETDFHKTFDEIYNKAVDHCIGTVKIFSQNHSLYNDPSLLFLNLISELKKLKSTETQAPIASQTNGK